MIELDTSDEAEVHTERELTPVSFEVHIERESTPVSFEEPKLWDDPEPPELFQKSEYTDITLIVEGKELHFAKHPLMAGSTVFANMIKGSEDKSRLELDDVTYCDMINFLECLHPKTLRLITDANLEQVAMISHRFKHEGILYRCEEYIVERFKQKSDSLDGMYPEFFFHLKVADKCEMKRAIQVGVWSAKVEKAFFSTHLWDIINEGYEHDKDFIQISADTKLQILSRRLKSTEFEIRRIQQS
ncbi:hypothetical protein CHS0354_016714 [Potamilus streckersoni]|uniref:BTB domain-containing protein n=1 Tax=Potamilus streckersoni TaxID=2493646 RepID=A0AAE0TCG2_9BIVA|nr:hypothetical protein CHS0354_016714 [Potamilus streckersoni]